jgi:hypothetical protein
MTLRPSQVHPLIVLVLPAILSAAPEIYSVSVPADAVPLHGRMEVSFLVSTVAENVQFPFDPSPPPGIRPSTGVSVDALFSCDDWATVHRIPAFYFQEFHDEVRGGREWFYPSGSFYWKARFSPPRLGSWQFRLVAEDASGTAQSETFTFDVTPSANRGFVRVSATDPRYFEYSDGSYFPALGFNMRFDELSWRNPVLDNFAQFAAMKENGIQLVRIWLSQWGIFGSEWNPWSAQDPALHGQYLPHTGITSEEAMPASEVSMKIDGATSPCMFIGAWKAPPAVKRDTAYRVRIRFKSHGITGPHVAGKPYGFLAKTGGWLWGGQDSCSSPGTGDPVTSRVTADSDGWEIIEAPWNSGSTDFMPNFFLVLENVTAGNVWVDHVWIEEDIGGGQFGANIVSKPSMAHHLYFEQRNSFAFDKLLAVAEEHGILLRPVLLEKNDRLLSSFDFNGNSTRPDNVWFYGDYSNPTKTRWLQQAFWRYAQARWGYSTSIHSWELLNEGDPFNSRHYTLVDEFGRFMHCGVFGIPSSPGEKCSTPGVNAHPVSTSFWHSFPREEFWSATAYPNVSFADVHQYVGAAEEGFADTALATMEMSAAIAGAGKPVVRGETGFVGDHSGDPHRLLLTDRRGYWLHDFLWAGLNPGGLIESYWYAGTHIHNPAEGVDHRPQFRALLDFLGDIPLNNGRYRDADPSVSNPTLRVIGQKDVVAGAAHLWIQNRERQWLRAVKGEFPLPADGQIVLRGFPPDRDFRLDWWDTWPSAAGPRVLRSEIVRSDRSGAIQFGVAPLVSDIAVRITSAQPVQVAR